jgi:dienelactone hydrolase
MKYFCDEVVGDVTKLCRHIRHAHRQANPFVAPVAAVLMLCLGLGACAEGPDHAAATAPADARDRLLAIPVTDADGRVTEMQTRVCRPATDGPARLVVINHGSPADSSRRPAIKPGSCDGEAARWFLQRGYVVAFPLRRGYGATGGAWAEHYGACDRADYFHAGLETARDIDAAVEGLTKLQFIRPDGVIVVGQSAGAWGTLAYDGTPHPKVAALIAMAPGRGGHQDGVPNKNCAPDRLVEAAGRYGASASTPLLWVSTVNDTFFAPPLARALEQSFAAGGGKVDFEPLGFYSKDGHGFFFESGASEVWGPIVGRYLAQQGASTP